MNLIEENNTCVCCGKIIPEGFQYCHNCYEDYEQIVAVNEAYKKLLEKRAARKRKVSSFFDKLLRLVK